MKGQHRFRGPYKDIGTPLLVHKNITQHLHPFEVVYIVSLCFKVISKQDLDDTLGDYDKFM